MLYWTMDASYDKRRFSGTRSLKTAWPIEVILLHNWLCPWDLTIKQNSWWLPQGFRLSNMVNLQLLGFFFITCTGWTSQLNLTCHASNDALSPKEVPFRGWPWQPISLRGLFPSSPWIPHWFGWESGNARTFLATHKHQIHLKLCGLQPGKLPLNENLEKNVPRISYSQNILPMEKFQPIETILSLGKELTHEQMESRKLLRHNCYKS